MLALTASEKFLGLYSLEKNLASFTSVGSQKFKETMPFRSFRKTLTDWLVDVQSEYKLSSETLHASILLVDRCLRHYEDIPSNKLQLLGITCLFVATKFYESIHPWLQDMIWVCDYTYTQQEHNEMEIKVMLLLDFQVYTITPASYITTLCASLKEGKQLELLAFFFTDLALVDGITVCTPPALIAAAATALAFLTLEREVPLNVIAHLCRVPVLSLKTHFCLMQRLHIDNFLAFGPDAAPAAVGSQPLHAVQVRYSSKDYEAVSLLPPRRPIVVQRHIGRGAPLHHCGWCLSSACAYQTMEQGRYYYLHASDDCAAGPLRIPSPDGRDAVSLLSPPDQRRL